MLWVCGRSEGFSQEEFEIKRIELVKVLSENINNFGNLVLFRFVFYIVVDCLSAPRGVLSPPDNCLFFLTILSLL